MENDRLARLQQTVDNWLVDRPVMSVANTPHALIALLRAELDEFEEAVNGMGDEKIVDQKKNIDQEFADLTVFLLSLASKLGVDIYAVTMEKMALNFIRYESRFFQDGDYDETRKMVKQREKDLKLKEQFYGD